MPFSARLRRRIWAALTNDTASSKRLTGYKQALHFKFFVDDTFYNLTIPFHDLRFLCQINIKIKCLGSK